MSFELLLLPKDAHDLDILKVSRLKQLFIALLQLVVLNPLLCLFLFLVLFCLFLHINIGGGGGCGKLLYPL